MNLHQKDGLGIKFTAC